MPARRTSRSSLAQLVTNPFGVIEALANFDPTVTTDLTSLPATISVELPPGLELAIAGLGATGATLTTLETVAQQLQSDPSLTNLSEGLATVLNAYLNGTDNISLLDGAITIPLYNGLLAPETSANIDINLTNLINALGLGNTPLSNLDLSSLLSQIGLGDLNLGSLFSDLGLSDKGLGDLLGNPTAERPSSATSAAGQPRLEQLEPDQHLERPGSGHERGSEQPDPE